MSFLRVLHFSCCSKLESTPDFTRATHLESGLHLFDCPNMAQRGWELAWLFRLIKEPCNFRCGFDIVRPWNKGYRWWDGEMLSEDSIIRILECDTYDNWIGFAFCVIFERNSDNVILRYRHESNSGSRPKIQLPYNWYVTEEEEVENIDAKVLIIRLEIRVGDDKDPVGAFKERLGSEQQGGGGRVAVEGRASLGFTSGSRRNLSSSVVRRRREVLSLLPPYVSPTSTNSKLIHHSTYKYFITSVHPNPKLKEHLHSHQSKLQIKLRTCVVPAPSRPSISIPPGGASTSNPTLVLRPTSPPTLHCSSPTTASWVWISPPAATSPRATILSVGRRSV
ncbi:uncharacterized protein HKW66_Vig0219850 [Vigna angularis]|uniref:Uncharacterized protein n=1 Tax=Phaseolus angularis TaxID=3914 RepID=A0A8T0JHT6_PHAAN|nr:uncharacterized protein HKW66_Vig0219850 [Vigna angularis]